MEYFKFETEEQAQAFCDKVSKGEGFGLNPENVTTCYCEPTEIEGEWFVIKDEITSKYEYL
jgi:hypothetical protein